MYNNPKTFKPFKNYVKILVDINYGEVIIPELPEYNPNVYV